MTQTTFKKYIPASLMSIDINVLNKILGSQVQKYIERLIYHDQMGFISRMEDGSIYTNQ